MTSCLVPVFSSSGVEIFSSSEDDCIQDDRTLLVLGGRAPDPDWTRDLVFRNSPVVWAADSGVGVCRALGIVPSLLIGDKDSALPDDWCWALSRGSEERVYDRDKDRTDFQLALSLFEDRANSEAAEIAPLLIVSGCFGGALDHLMSVFFTLASSGGNFSRCMIDEREGAFFIASGESATLKFERPPESISLLPITDECFGVGISGVKWPLDGIKLERRYPWAVSNEIIKDPCVIPDVTARCGEGILALYWRW